MGELFTTITVHLSHTPPQGLVRWDPVSLHGQQEAIQKIHRFCHEIYRVPVTWIVAYDALLTYGELLAQYCRDYGDEVGILEYGVQSRHMLGSEPEQYQRWVEPAGLRRPDEFQSDEPELLDTRSWNDMPYAEQRQGIAYLKGEYERILGRKVGVFACPFVNGDTVRVLRELDFTVLWAHNWNYFCEGINNRGCPAFPFYPGEASHNIPAREKEPKGPLAIHWGPFSPALFLNVGTMTRREPAWCLNAMELCNRSLVPDEGDFCRRVLTELAQEAAHNPYIHIPLQIEAVWIDEGEELPGYYDQYPQFNSRCTEAFYTEVETCLRLGANVVTQSAFAAWHKAHIGDTAEVTLYSEDPAPAVRGNGKDRAYAPVIVHADRHRQYIFSRCEGFGYVRKYDYDRPETAQLDHGEMPFASAPPVYLQTKRSRQVRAGIVLDPAGARYAVEDFSLTAFRDEPGYAAVLWEANIPAFVRDEDLQMGGALTGFKALRDRNALLLFADLPEGDSELQLFSDRPQDYIRIKDVATVGKRVEIWIRNDGDACSLVRLTVPIGKGLKLGGFYWDGVYGKSILSPAPGYYDRNTGELCLGAVYPRAFPLRAGLTRVSVELL